MSYITEDGRQQPDPNVDLVRQSPTHEPLSPFLILFFYSQGIFPWLRNIKNQRLWWSLEPRSVLLPSEVHISKKVQKTIRKNIYRVTADTCFNEVIQLCGSTRKTTWITPEVIQVFTDLHHMGHAHSIEVWENDQLVGGLYGVCIGQVFHGCSMFSIKPNASKIALIKLSEKLSEWGFPLIDCQLHNPHLQKMGARLIPRATFLRILKPLVRGKQRVGSWSSAFP